MSHWDDFSIVLMPKMYNITTIILIILINLMEASAKSPKRILLKGNMKMIHLKSY